MTNDDREEAWLDRAADLIDSRLDEIERVICDAVAAVGDPDVFVVFWAHPSMGEGYAGTRASFVGMGAPHIDLGEDGFLAPMFRDQAAEEMAADGNAAGVAFVAAPPVPGHVPLVMMVDGQWYTQQIESNAAARPTSRQAFGG